ncbi:MAG: glycosyl transferase family protein [Pseudomonadota bacterium]
MSLAKYVHAMGRGPSRGRSLTRYESHDAMLQILSGDASPEAVGALLMLMRYRGEVAEEIAGFVDAMREGLHGWSGIGASVDWPSYAAGRSRGVPWFLLSARLIARAGHPVLLHGWNSHQGNAADVRKAVALLGIPEVETPDAAASELDRSGLAYVPLDAIDPRILTLLRLRDIFGLRSAVNTCCRMLNPALAPTSVQGVFHPGYRPLQQEAGELLGQHHLLVLKGGGGEFERNPAKTIEFWGLRGGARVQISAPPLKQEHRTLADAEPDPAHLTALWTGALKDPFAEVVVTGTAAAVLLATGAVETLEHAEADAEALWHDRHRSIAA